MSYLKVKEDTSYVRETSSRALLNIDNSGLVAYKKQKLIRSRNAKQLETLTDDVNNLKQDITEIKELLVKLIDK
jgi:hypothetical protein